jgi:hypothetical protein
MRRRRRLWLLLAVVLFGLGAALMISGQGEEQAPAPRQVQFPRRMRSEEWKRLDRRRVLVAPPAAPGPEGLPPPKPRDPMLEALPRGEGRTAVVIEANAVRHSPVGELLLECLMMRGGGRGLERFRQQTGVDPLEDVDRLALTDKGMIVSGHFGEARFQELLADRVSADYGQKGRVYEARPRELPDGGVRRGREPAFGVWGDSMLVVGQTADEVKATIDRIEGRGPQEPPLLTENQTYGEMYGVVSVEQLARFFPPEQRELAEQLQKVAQRAELHMDVRSDFAMVAEVNGADAAQVEDLGKSLGAALSLARLQAQHEGEQELAQLLDFARVRPDGTSFRMELAVPIEVLREQLSWCRQEEQRAESEDGGVP